MSSLLQALMAGLLAGLALHFSAFRQNFRAYWHWECAAGVAVALLVFAAGGFWKPAVDRSSRPLAHADADAGFVSSGACQSCHPAQHASWQHSFHRTMTQEPTPETAVSYTHLTLPTILLV